MPERLYILCVLILGLMAEAVMAQTSSDSLCDLQMQLRQGEHQNVQVEGVYLSGLEGQYLVSPNCPGKSTFVEFKLRTHRLWKELVRLSNRTNNEKHASGDGDPVLVLFEGELFGPRVPDPKLPTPLRKNYHPGWDPMNASMTKMIVHVIHRVQHIPAGHPCAPLKSDPGQWPCFKRPRSPL